MQQQQQQQQRRRRDDDETTTTTTGSQSIALHGIGGVQLRERTCQKLGDSAASIGKAVPESFDVPPNTANES